MVKSCIISSLHRNTILYKFKARVMRAGKSSLPYQNAKDYELEYRNSQSLDVLYRIGNVEIDL